MMGSPPTSAPSVSRAILPAGSAARRRISTICRGIAADQDQERVVSVIETRHNQIFPVLLPTQIEMAKRFASGPARDFAPGEIVYDIGERHAPAWLVLKGSIDSVRRDGLKHEHPITTHQAGQITGEVSQLAGRPMLAAG